MQGKSFYGFFYPVRLVIVAVLLFIMAGCANGILGKKGVGAVNGLTGAVNTTTTKVTDVVTQTRNQILAYLKDSAGVTSREITMGVLQGTIGYLDDSANRVLLMQFIDDLITHAVGPAREQLIELKDSLLDQKFVAQVSSLAHNLMHELVLEPSRDLVQNVVLGKTTREGLEALLRMPIPAILNDSAIRQICKLRECLLGLGLKRDIAGLLDTALWVANRRLDTPLRKTIVSIVKESSDAIKHQANDILYVIIGGVILISLIIFALQWWLLYKRKRMMFYITNEIEKFRKTSGEQNFQQLTGQIRATMLDKRLEGDLRRFLYKEGINKTP